MNEELAGERRLTLKQAADELGASYTTIREYVVIRQVVPHERRGLPSGPSMGSQGRLVLIDELGLDRLRKLLPSPTLARS